MEDYLEKVVKYMTHYEYNIPIMEETFEIFKDIFKENGFDIELEDMEEIIMKDPYLALKIVLKVSHLKKTNLRSDIDCMKKALLLLGTKNVLSMVLSSPVMLKHEGVNLAIKRATYASRIARKFSEIRFDIRPTEVQLSTLLADLGELMMWTFKPELATLVTEKMKSRECTRNAQAQQAVFGFKYRDLSVALGKAWGLSSPIINMLEHKEREHVRARLSHLCVDLARHVYGIDGYREIPSDIEKLKETMEVEDSQNILNVIQLGDILPADEYLHILENINQA